MDNKIIFFYGILHNGKVIELNSDNAFNNPSIVYLIRGDLRRKTPKGFKIFEYSLFIKDSKVEDRIIKWGNIKCELPATDIWGSISGGNNNGVVFRPILNNKFVLTFVSEKHSIKTIEEMMNVLVTLKTHYTSIKKDSVNSLK